MWADNEADNDLLGFDFLVDSLVVALTEPRLLPLTIGVLGDWGSGKSSLMRIAENEVLATPDSTGVAHTTYVTVRFSPWRYEDHDDVKVALMTAVLDELAGRVGPDDERVSRLRIMVAGMRRWGRRLGRAGVAAAPVVLPVVVPDVDPTLIEAATTAAAAATAPVADQPEEPGAPATRVGGMRSDIDEFHREFSGLVDSITDRGAVIVFIDDLDRCLPDTVVDTFETIRLFLNAPKTAYVLALNQNVVEGAIDSRYPDQKRSDGAGIGRDYLEKMLQLKIVIPSLSAAEAETYIHLLFAELHLDDTDFAAVLDRAQTNRRDNALGVAFNTGIAGDVLVDVPDALVADLTWAGSIAPILGTSLRGNPRQLKRFLNNLLLKYRSARRRRTTIELPVLAKLMVLEDQYHSDFQRVHDWEAATPGGGSDELATAERHARAIAEAPTNSSSTTDGSDTGEAGPAPVRRARGARPNPSPPPSDTPTNDQPSDDVTAWAAKPHVDRWLKTDPPLAGLDLRPYFTYSRDKLSLGVSSSRMAPHLQRLLTDVQSDVDGRRRAQYGAVLQLDPTERVELVEALLDRAQRSPGSPALIAAIEIAEKDPAAIDAVCQVLQRIPVSTLPNPVLTSVVRRLPPDNSHVAAVTTAWRHSGDERVSRLVTLAVEAKAGKA